MAKAKPIIATNVGGLSELVEDSKGTLIDRWKTDEWDNKAPPTI